MISIITPTFGRSNKLIKAIDSVIFQSYNNFEYLIIDDNGLDTSNQIKTSQIVSNYDNNQIIYIPLDLNSGACVARNKGIDIAKGEYVVFLDDDDEFPELYLENFVKNSHYLNSGDAPFSFLFVPYELNILTKYKISLDDILYRNYVGNSIFIERQLLVSLRFDTTLPAAQDYDLWIRIIKNNGSALGIRGDSIIHHKDGKRITNSNNAIEGYLSVLNKNKSIMSIQQISSMQFSIDILRNRVDFISYKGIKNKLRAIKYLVIKWLSPRLYKKYYL